MKVTWKLEDESAVAWAHKNRTEGVLCCFGGTDLHAQALLDASPKSKSIIMWDEWGLVSPRDRVRCCRNLATFRSVADLVEIRRRGFRLVSPPGWRERFPREYGRVARILAREGNAWQSDIVTSLRFSSEWQKNMLLNFRHFEKSPPIQRVFGKWKRPIIVIGSGPSAEADLTWVNWAKDRAYIISAGSSIGACLKARFEPDLTVAFDGGFDNYRAHYRDLGEHDTILCWDMILNHRVCEEWTGPMVSMLMWPMQWISMALQMDLSMVRIGPSVSNTALDIALQMGGDPIILVGQDCCYRGGRTHVSGAYLIEQHYSIPDQKDMVAVPAVNGGEVFTTKTMSTFLYTFESMLSGLDRKIINTSFGAKIPNTQDIDLRPTLNQYCQVDLKNEKAEIRRILTELPTGYNLDNFALYRKSAKVCAEQLLANLDRIDDLREEISKPVYGPFAFGFQPLYAMALEDKDKARNVMRKAIENFLPYC